MLHPFTPGDPTLDIEAWLAANGTVFAVFDAHVEVARRGFVAVDLYDGCFLYDFERGSLRLFDLDEYRPGPFVVEGDRLPGSTRFMAPEEQQRGATIDERTTVFNLGRVARVLLDEGDNTGRFRGPAPLHAVAEQATEPRPSSRFATVAAFVDAWRAAEGLTGRRRSPRPR